MNCEVKHPRLGSQLSHKVRESQCCCKVATVPMARYAAKVVQRCYKLTCANLDIGVRSQGFSKVANWVSERHIRRRRWEREFAAYSCVSDEAACADYLHSCCSNAKDGLLKSPGEIMKELDFDMDCGYSDMDCASHLNP
jgi:hypothetical protein